MPRVTLQGELSHSQTVLDSWAVEGIAQLEARHMVSQVRALGQE